MSIFKKIRNLIRFIYNLDRICIDEIINYRVDSYIGNKVKFNGSYNIANSQIGDYTYISQNARISLTLIGKYCSIGPNFLAGWGIHPTNGISTSPMFYSTKKQNGYSFAKIDLIEERKNIIIGNDVFIGANVIVLDGVIIGDGAVIGAGSVVSKNIPPYAIAVGSPIKIIKYRFSEEEIIKLLSIRWWDLENDIHTDISKSFFNLDEFLRKTMVNA
jgi:acetyltransferase-like isoleucine patch superfamily enzyme